MHSASQNDAYPNFAQPFSAKIFNLATTLSFHILLRHHPVTKLPHDALHSDDLHAFTYVIMTELLTDLDEFFEF